MSTMAASPPTSFASPRSANELDELIDLSAFGGSTNGSRQSSPMDAPLTPTMDSTIPSNDVSSDAFYQSFFRDGPGPSTDHLTLNEKDIANSWNSFSSSLNEIFMPPGDSLVDQNSALNSYGLFSSPDFANGGSLAQQDINPLSANSTTSILPTIQEDNYESSQSFAIDPSLVTSTSASNTPFGTLSPTSAEKPSAAAERIASPTAASKPLPKKRQPSVSTRSAISNHDDDADEDEGSDPEGDEEEDEDLELKTITDEMNFPFQSFSNGASLTRGLTSRKSASGIIQTGGVAKRTTSAVVNLDKDPNDLDDWRPSPEEYKKLSSKEKRQLRNKISARNFRIRRKEYITTLESHIADRDQLIDAIKHELGESKTENDVLRAEIETLKKAMLEGRSTVESLGLQTPVKLDDNGEPIRPQSPVRRASTFAKANKRKDVGAPGSPAFWGGAQSNGLFGGGVTSVHTTLVPETPAWNLLFPQGAPASLSSPSSTSSLLSGKGWWGREPENLNPLLNKLPVSPTASSPSSLPSLDSDSSDESSSSTSSPRSKPMPHMPGLSRFDAFMEINPFTIKSAEDYRMHLWAQMAQAKLRQQQAMQSQHTAQQSFDQHFAQPQYTGSKQQVDPGSKYDELFASMRPAFFSASSSANKPKSDAPERKGSLASLLAGKMHSSPSGSATPRLPSPPTSPKLGAQKTPSSSQLAPTPQQAFVATLATQTLLSRMGSAFWDAFAGRPTGTGASQQKTWDTDKVRKVLEGKAVVRVVDVDSEPQFNEKRPDATLSGLEDRMRGMSINATANANGCCESKPLTEATGVFHNLRKA